MQKIYLYLMACAMGAMSLASCSEESSTPDADGGGDGTIEVPLAQVAKPKPNPWLAQEEYRCLLVCSQGWNFQYRPRQVSDDMERSREFDDSCFDFTKLYVGHE